MSDIFREVDEALQQEKIAKIWQEYGSLIVTLVAVLILSTAGFSAYYAWEIKHEENQTSKLITAIEADDQSAALNAVINEAPKNYANIAVLSAAGAHLQSGEYEHALKVYQDAIENNKIDAEFEDLARLMIVRIQMGIEKDQADGAELLKTLEPAMTHSSSPWINHIKAENALIEAHFNQNYKGALDTLNSVLESDSLPNDLKTRIEDMKRVYSLQLSKQEKLQKG